MYAVSIIQDLLNQTEISAQTAHKDARVMLVQVHREDLYCFVAVVSSPVPHISVLFIAILTISVMCVAVLCLLALSLLALSLLALSLLILRVAILRVAVLRVAILWPWVLWLHSLRRSSLRLAPRHRLGASPLVLDVPILCFTCPDQVDRKSVDARLAYSLTRSLTPRSAC